MKYRFLQKNSWYLRGVKINLGHVHLSRFWLGSFQNFGRVPRHFYRVVGGIYRQLLCEKANPEAENLKAVKVSVMIGKGNKNKAIIWV